METELPNTCSPVGLLFLSAGSYDSYAAEEEGFKDGDDEEGE